MAETSRGKGARRALFTAGEAAGVIGSACKGNLGAPIVSVAVDSRKVEPGSLFVALKGEKVDGHDFISDALRGGASCVIADSANAQAARRAFELSGKFAASCLILVDSPLAALQSLAAEHRRRMRSLLRVGVTGSSGKTTTKECVAAMLEAAYGRDGSVAMNLGNLNSDIGLALSMFGINPAHKVGVFEMGMNRVGEMGELVRMYEPEYAIITNVGTAHIGIIGSRQGIAREKKEIFSRFSGGQVGFVWEKDDFADYLAADVKGKVVKFGTDSTVGVEGIKNKGLAGWEILWKGQRIDFSLVGAHNLSNAMAALSLAAELRLEPEAVREGLSSVRPLFGRSEIYSGNITLIQDCYNSNPDSASAAMDFCDGVQWEGRKVYVLGSMLELGGQSAASHEAMGKRAANSEAEAVFFFGEDAKAAFRGFRAETPAKFGFHTEDMEELVGSVGKYIRDGDLLLLKASRGMALERLVGGLKDSGKLVLESDEPRVDKIIPEGRGAPYVP